MPGTVPYTFELSPDLATGGYFEWFGSADTIQRGTVQFRTAARMADFSLVLHELTHGFGLSHSDRVSDVMHPSAVAEAHSERERSVIDAVKRRPPGTAFEDNVRGAHGRLAARAHLGLLRLRVAVDCRPGEMAPGRPLPPPLENE